MNLCNLEIRDWDEPGSRYSGLQSLFTTQREGNNATRNEQHKDLKFHTVWPKSLLLIYHRNRPAVHADDGMHHA